MTTTISPLPIIRGYVQSALPCPAGVSAGTFSPWRRRSTNWNMLNGLRNSESANLIPQRFRTLKETRMTTGFIRHKQGKNVVSLEVFFMTQTRPRSATFETVVHKNEHDSPSERTLGKSWASQVRVAPSCSWWSGTQPAGFCSTVRRRKSQAPKSTARTSGNPVFAPASGLWLPLGLPDRPMPSIVYILSPLPRLGVRWG